MDGGRKTLQSHHECNKTSCLEAERENASQRILKTCKVERQRYPLSYHQPINRGVSATRPPTNLVGIIYNFYRNYYNTLPFSAIGYVKVYLLLLCLYSLLSTCYIVSVDLIVYNPLIGSRWKSLTLLEEGLLGRVADSDMFSWNSISVFW